MIKFIKATYCKLTHGNHHKRIRQADRTNHYSCDKCEREWAVKWDDDENKYLNLWINVVCVCGFMVIVAMAASEWWL